MRDKDLAKRQTPLSPPLTGGKVRALKKSAPPLLRGGREGFGFVPYNKNLTALARENRKNSTAAESKVWYQLLRLRNLSAYKFTRQKPVLNYITDFYCAELRLVIEIDGGSHAESIVYDTERTNALSSLGITVIRYTNDDILNNMQGVYVDLMRKIAVLKGAD